MKSSRKLAEYISKSGSAFKKSPLYKGDTKKVKGPDDYGKRQSKNIQDVRDRKSKAFKIADAKGKLDDKVFHGTEVTENKRIKKVSPIGTRNRNIFMNSERILDPVGHSQKVKNKKLNSKPTKFKKGTK